MNDEDRLRGLRASNEAKRAQALLPIGSRFGLLLVVGHNLKKGRTTYNVRCNCGTRKEVQKANLLRAKSCGCLTSSIISNRQTRHGMTDTPTWRSWKSMIDRCETESHKSYQDYGGRGIAVCDSWHKFENFFADMGERPKGMQLDRVDNEGNYNPSNCRWATASQNCNNRRSSRRIAFRGEVLTIAQWASRLEISAGTLWRRLERWSVEEALTRPLQK